jgi:hemerythrin-like domain-containing protein
MLRDKSLIPLSHQHQRALALCVRIDRAEPIPAADIEVWQAEIGQLFEQEIKIHLAAEEDVLFPKASEFQELLPLVEELVADHTALRKLFTQAEERRMSEHSLSAFAQHLSTHIRKEERQLFERLQQLLTAEQLTTLGKLLQTALADGVHACALPTPATRLKPKR